MYLRFSIYTDCTNRLGESVIAGFSNCIHFTICLFVIAFYTKRAIEESRYQASRSPDSWFPVLKMQGLPINVHSSLIFKKYKIKKILNENKNTRLL